MRKYLDRTFAVVLAAGLVFNSSTDVFGTSLVTPPTFNQSASIFTGQALAARPTSIPIHLAGDALCQVVQLLEAFWNILPGYSRFAHSTHMSFFGVPPLPPKEESPTFYRVAESGEVHFIYARHDTRQDYEDIHSVLSGILAKAGARSQKVHLLLEGDLFQAEDLGRFGPIALLGELGKESANSEQLKERVLHLIDLFFHLPFLASGPDAALIDSVLETFEDPLLANVYDRLFDRIARLKPWYRLRIHLKDQDRFYTALLEALRALRKRPKVVFRHLEIPPRVAQVESLRRDLLSFRAGTTWDVLVRGISNVLRLRRPPLLDQVRAIRKTDREAVIVVVRGSYHREDHRALVEQDHVAVWVHSYPAGYFASPTYALQQRFIREPDAPADTQINDLSNWSFVERLTRDFLSTSFPHHVQLEIAVNQLVDRWQKEGLSAGAVLDAFQQLGKSDMDTSPLETGILDVLESRESNQLRPVIESHIEKPNGAADPPAVSQLTFGAGIYILSLSFLVVPLGYLTGVPVHPFTEVVLRIFGLIAIAYGVWYNRAYAPALLIAQLAKRAA